MNEQVMIVEKENCSWIYINKFNDKVMLITKNPCGCCPNDYLLEWGKRFNEKCSTVFNRGELSGYLDSRGYEYLDVVQL